MRAGTLVAAILSPAKIVVPVGAALLPTVTVPGVTITPKGDAATVSAKEKGAVTISVRRAATIAEVFVAADLLVMFVLIAWNQFWRSSEVWG
jgi:hypothetical protein